MKATINSFPIENISGGILLFEIGLSVIKDRKGNFTSAQNTYFQTLIWRKVVIAPSISSIYRQWTLPKALGIPKSNNHQNQNIRWKTVLKQWGKAHKENKEIFVLTDDNIDHNNNTFNTNYKVNNIKDMTLEFLSDNNYTTHNEHTTYHIKQ